MESLVNDLLAYSGSDQERFETVDIGAVIAQTVALLRHEAEPHHVNIISECQDGILATGNPDRLGQVLLNLGKNAIQAIYDGGTLRITADIDGSQVIIMVSDDGHGISPADLPRIFEPFFTTKARGTGLGLALCKKIVEEHGGKIAVQSNIGQGTSVSMAIPVLRNQKP